MKALSIPQESYQSYTFFLRMQAPLLIGAALFTYFIH